MPEAFSLEGKTALLAGRLWLPQLARTLASGGAKVAVIVPEGDGEPPGIDRLGADRIELLAIATKLSDPVELEASIGRIERELGTVDVLVNSWVAEAASPCLSIAQEEWEQAISFNLSFPFYLCQAVGRGMVERRHGCMVNLVSGLATRAIANATASCAALAALLHLTRALAVEWARNGVRVNCLEVGWMEGADRDFSIEGIDRFIPLRRVGKPAEIGSALLYLCSDASSFMTGQVLSVDGGATAHA